MSQSILAQVTRTLRLDAAGRATLNGSAPATPPSNAPAHSWKLFDSSPDLMLMLRDAPVPERPALERRAILAGDLSAIAAADLVMFINQGSFTGILIVRSEGVDRTLSFKNGKLCWASSTDVSERLGEVAVRNGLISQEALAKLAEPAECDDPGKKLGQKLVQMGLLNGHQQWRALQLHVTEIFFSFLIKRTGGFVFVDAPKDPTLDSHLTIDPQGLLLEGVRRIDEMRHFRRRIPSSTVTPRRSEKALPEGLDGLDVKIAELLDGQRNIIQLGMSSAAGEFAATKAVHHLVELGVAIIDETAAREKTPSPVSNGQAGALERFNRALTEIYQAARDAGMDAPYRLSLDLYLVSERASSPLFVGLTLEPDGTLPTETVQARARNASESALREQLEQVLSFALFQAKEILDPAAADALAKRARTLTAG